jgi:hypothetical protein
MDQDRVLAVFLNVINTFVQLVSSTHHCMLVIEFGYQQPYCFQCNIGSDFIKSVYVRCCSNNIQKQDTINDVILEKPFVIYEHYYQYSMTPFDLRYRLFHLSEHVDNKYRYILNDTDSYFMTIHDTIVFFNESTGRLGIACDIEAARLNYLNKTNTRISDFFLIHQCCLIVRDICMMIEPIISDTDTCLISLQRSSSQIHLS